MQGTRSIHSTFGVRHLVKFGDRPARLPEQFVSDLKAREVDGVIPHQPLEDVFCEGKTVIIKEGAFKDFMATVLSCSTQDRVIVLLDFLKRTVRTAVPADYLERT